MPHSSRLTPPAGSAAHRARGSASSVLLGLIAMLLTAGLTAYMVLRDTESPPGPEPVLPGETAEAPADVSGGEPAEIADPDLADVQMDGPRTLGGVESRPIGGYEEFTKAFGDMGGTILGEIRVEGAEYPEIWTVTLEPSLAAEGREAAITKTYTSEPGMRTFELRDLPLAAYRLSASAPGLATSKIEVALYRVEGQPSLRGLDFINVDLTLHPTARIEGAVRQANGDVADELAVYMTPYKVPGAAPSKAELELGGDVTVQYKTRTNASGTYTFEDVPPGPWLLHVGDPLHPLVPAIPVGVDKTDQRLDDLKLPPLADLELVVLDQLARPCPGVEVTGYLRSAGSGKFRAVTDGVGVARVRYLAPGPWRVNADDKEFKQKGQGDLVLQPGGRPDGRMEEIQVR